MNVSARTQVTGGDNTLIAGFVISGTTARTVLIRAAGPVLSSFGVAGALADPKLALFRGNTRLAESDNWQSSTELVNAFGVAGAFNFNARSRDLSSYHAAAWRVHRAGFQCDRERHGSRPCRGLRLAVSRKSRPRMAPRQAK